MADPPRLYVNWSIDQLKRSVEDASTRLCTPHCLWYAWPQVWPTTAAGHPADPATVGTQLTRAQTVVAFVPPQPEQVLVYHAGLFAYAVLKPLNDFWVLVDRRRLPGAVEWETSWARYAGEKVVEET